MQVPAPFEYERATSVDDALARLARLGPEARIIAGGHSLLPMMKLRLATPEHLVDINDLSDLAYITEQDGEIRIGAMTRHRELLESCRAEERHVNRRCSDEQALIRADVRRRFAAPDVLFARLEREREALLAIEIDGAADDSTGHLAYMLPARRPDAEVRPARR